MRRYANLTAMLVRQRMRAHWRVKKLRKLMVEKRRTGLQMAGQTRESQVKGKMEQLVMEKLSLHSDC